tara:strand:- start:1342 stop:2358 length:1017 start_codon:yes stop_codon:yes gene_type:complete
MINSSNVTSKLAIDTKSVDDIRLLARQDSDQGLKEVAQQFEALFMNMMLKSMREATSKDGMFDSKQTEFYTQMLDQQMAQSLSSKGLGLADMMVQQLSRSLVDPVQPGTSISSTEAILTTINPSGQSISGSSGASGDKSRLLWPNPNTSGNKAIPSETLDVSVENMSIAALTPNIPLSLSSNQPEDFVNALLPHARIAAQETGIPAHFMIAQAALESGWGKHEIRHTDNSLSHNLFGIKAGQNWKGAVVETVTTEYVNGIPQKMVEKFRAYDSYAEGFRDYANLLSNNPRYAAVLESQDADGFANGLQKAGYATDPNYADKLIRILNSDTLRNDNQTI